MAIRKWAFIFESPGFSPAANTVRSSTPECEFIAVGIDPADREQVLSVARDLVAEGVQMIELCGAFGPEWMARISQAVNDAVPVGGVAYGPQHFQRMLDIVTSD